MKIEYDELRSKAWDLTNVKQKLSVLEEAIKVADTYLSEEDSYEARMAYSREAAYEGFEDRFLVTFSSCISRYDKNPDQYHAYEIIWHYKWFLNQIWRYPQMTQEKIMYFFDDFKRRCTEHDYSLRPYFQNLHRYHLYNGLYEEAGTYFKEWRKSKRDGMTDCMACEHNGFGMYHLKKGHYKRGLLVLQPILEGKQACKSVPQTTFAGILLPLLEAGRDEEARKYAKKGIKLLEGSSFIFQYGDFLKYYTITDLNKAATLFQKTIRYGLETKVPFDKLHFLISVRLFLEKWYQKNRRKTFSVPDYFSLEWVIQITDELIEAFDRRNQNSYFSDYLENSRNQIKRLGK